MRFMVYGLYPHVINSCDPSDYSSGLCKYQKKIEPKPLNKQIIDNILINCLSLRKFNKNNKTS